MFVDPGRFFGGCSTFLFKTGIDCVESDLF